MQSNVMNSSQVSSSCYVRKRSPLRSEKRLALVSFTSFAEVLWRILYILNFQISLRKVMKSNNKSIDI